MPNPILFQNSCHVCFGYIICEGAVSKDNLRIACRFQFLMPGDDTLGDILYLVLVDRSVQTGKQHPITNAVNRLACNFFFLNGDGQINATFQEEFKIGRASCRERV